MHYCKITTENHPLSVNHKDCLEQINQIVEREGGRNNSFNTDLVALNLDLVERKNSPDQPRPTMDFTFGISKDLKNPNMVLTDLKLNHKTPKTIRRRDLVDKVDGSISLLNRDVTIYSEYFFVFKDNLKEQARSHFRSIFSGRTNLIFVPIKVSELRDKFFI